MLVLLVILREQIKRSVALRTGLDHPPVSVDANPAPRGQVLLVVVDQESDRRVGGKVGEAMNREGRFRLCVDAE